MKAFQILTTAFVIGFFFLPVLIKILKKTNVIDVPGGRKIHKGFIPSMGGIGFVAATLLSVAIWFNFEDVVQTRYFLAAFGLMFFVGLRDDLVDLTAWQKLGGQMVAAYMVVVVADIRLEGFYGFLGIWDIPVLISYGLSMFIILALTNSFNLIDGLDGLAGSLAIISFTFLGYWFFVTGLIPYALFSFACVGGVLSFLVFNWHPAKIFMGDTGSLSLGFALSTLTILFINANGTMTQSDGILFMAPLATGMAVLIIPIYDTLRVFVRRIKRGKSPMEADKSHIHHFLLRMGMRHDQVAMTLAVIKIVFLGVAIIGSSLTDAVMIPVIAGMALALGLGLDKITLKQVKKTVRKAPPVLDARRAKAAKKKQQKPEIPQQIVQNAGMMKN
ncbi:glycosyltransferase family 4 protein [Mongoliitalea daihaiensis]|uniref:glycosyltransferase family 4 protein n=1 Tax=Mongoliitalea daihaiensis TaxID=2782006 RepID=UPI001F3D69A5|nr:MraY family glycosyltransferase [Mongoliitalea daihaiensis]UJP63394.1 undecaprenyl/decaprenyl-phosphate alpha-N-acetylglucosaminyl 1-phosphate transferase [Mongoliitalea daihaiensis]